MNVKSFLMALHGYGGIHTSQIAMGKIDVRGKVL